MTKIADIKALVDNERGMALIVSMLLLAVMSILATLLMTNSTTEIQLSSNYRDSRQAYYATERGISYALRNSINNQNSVDLYNFRNQIEIQGGDAALEFSAFVPGTDERNSVVYIGTGDPSAGSGYSANDFEALTFEISLAAIAPANQANPSRAALHAYIQKIVPKVR